VPRVRSLHPPAASLMVKRACARACFSAMGENRTGEQDTEDRLGGGGCGRESAGGRMALLARA
jgi:hypothetical protein